MVLAVMSAWTCSPPPYPPNLPDLLFMVQNSSWRKKENKEINKEYVC